MDGARKNELLEMLVDVRRVTANDHTTHSRIRNGKLRQLTKSLYVEASEWKKLEPYEQEFLRCCAASMQSTKAVLVGFSAARVCGVWVHYDTKPGVQVALPSGKPPSAKAQSPGIEYKRMAVPDEDVFDRAGVRFTNAIRTAIDIARSSGERSGIIAFESLLTRCSDSEADLIREECAAMMQRMRGTKGIGKARHALAKATNRSESTYETLLRLILEKYGIKCHAQVIIGPYRVDLLFGDLIIEVDGWEKTKKKPAEAYAKQINRENWLKEQGFKVIRVTPKEIDRNEVLVVRRVLDMLEVESQTPRQVPRLYQPKGPSRQEFFPVALAARLRG